MVFAPKALALEKNAKSSFIRQTVNLLGSSSWP
jgi:hypothetical protein